MALIVVGGQTKHVGKTTLICNIIRSFPEVSWIAVKISPHVHDPVGKTRVLESDSGWVISEQCSRGVESDTARFIEVGAARSLLLYSTQESLAEACSRLKTHLTHAQHVIVESSGALRFLRSDLALLVLSPGSSDFKSSAINQLSKFDAVLVKQAERAKVGEGLRQVPTFELKPDGLSTELIALLKRVLARS